MKVEITQTDNKVMVSLAGRLDTVTSSEFEKNLAPYFAMNGIEQRRTPRCSHDTQECHIKRWTVHPPQSQQGSSLRFRYDRIFTHSDNRVGLN